VVYSPRSANPETTAAPCTKAINFQAREPVLKAHHPVDQALSEKRFHRSNIVTGGFTFSPLRIVISPGEWSYPWAAGHYCPPPPTMGLWLSMAWGLGNTRVKSALRPTLHVFQLR